jgi:hypothetical protein
MLFKTLRRRIPDFSLLPRAIGRSALIVGLVAATTAPVCRGDDTGPFSPLSFQNGVGFDDPTLRWKMNLRFRTQLGVFAATELGNEPASVGGQVRRLRLRLFGNAFSKELLYTIQLSFSRADMDWDNTSFPNVVRDAVIVWRATDFFQLSFGQSKLPGNRQRVVSSGEMQFADRSIVNRAFNIDRDFAVQAALSGKLGLGDAIGNARFAISNGEGRNILTPDAGLAYTARLELLPFGAFADNGDYYEGDLAYERAPKLSFGGGYSWNERTRRTGGQLGRDFGGNQTRSMGTAFADAVFKYRGFSLYGEAMYRHAKDAVVDAASRLFVLTGYGALAQAGYFLDDRWELVARAAMVRPAVAVEALAKEQVQWTVGVNRYLNHHRVKLQADVTWNTETDRATAVTERNWLGRFQIELGI